MVPLALLYIKCSEKNSFSPDAGAWSVTNKMCKRTGRLTVHLNEFFFSINGISRSCCWIKPGNKTTCWNFAHRLTLLDCIIFLSRSSVSRRKWITYTTNVSAHPGVTLKKKKTNKQTIKRKITVKPTMNVFMCFWISFIALLGWISEIRKKKTKQKKKNRKPQKLTLTHQMEHRRVLSSQTYGFSFTSAKPSRQK